MSTSSIKTPSATTSAGDFTILWRFIWKEFRMLRGLWLAVALMGFAVQCAAKIVLPPSSDLPTILLSTALASAVLYAAGAAATMFSVEHEEETYAFLSNLPTSWWPLFAGKLLATAGSAVLLAAALSIIGALVRGRGGLIGAEAPTVLGVLGTGILEALAWGTLFSLIVKRPLMAAILTLVIGLLVINIVVSETSTDSVASTNPRAYVEAIPMRLAIVSLVLASSALVARRWLVAGPRPTFGARISNKEGFAARFAHVFGRTSHLGRIAERGSRRRMLARLLWQTWRESWKLLFLPLGVAVALLVAQAVFSQLIRWDNEAAQFFLAAMLLFIPALYGTLAFHADQRRGNYQFLAEHAARPRYAWFARHVVWLGSLVAIATLLILILAAATSFFLGIGAWQFFTDFIRWGDSSNSAQSFVYSVANGVDDGSRFVCLAAGSSLVAYGIGQLCSMAIRSEILATFVSLVLSIVVAMWMAVLFAWRLPGWLFLFPLFAGFMMATWLRAPAWIASRKTWRSWFKPALAFAAPLLFVAAVLPTARLAQFPLIARDSADNRLTPKMFVPESRLIQSENTPEARATADMYIKAAERLTSVTIKNPLEPWETGKYQNLAPGQTLESQIPADQLPAYHAAKKELESLRHAEDLATIGLAFEASKRPACHFDFDSLSIGVRPTDMNRSYNLQHSCPIYGKLIDLLKKLALTQLEPAKPFDGYLAALRMSNQLRSGQPSIIFIDQLEQERNILDWISNRATAETVTKDQLRNLLEKLRTHYSSEPSPIDSLAADDILVRKVINGKDTPLILAGPPYQPPVLLHDYLAYLANELPWEQFRASRALDWITLYNTNEMRRLIEYLHNSQPNDWTGGPDLRRWLRPRSGFQLPDSWTIELQSATTSYLASLEYMARVSVAELSRAYCDTEVCRRAAQIRIALAMYRLDHKNYPPNLADLVPEYLPALPLDPYGRQPFQYLPAGLDLPLHVSPWQSRMNFHSINPHTPFFWSIGICNVQLRQMLKDPPPLPNPSDTDAAPSAAGPGDVGSSTKNKSQTKSELVYTLTGSDPSWLDGSVFAFPLPK